VGECWWGTWKLHSRATFGFFHPFRHHSIPHVREVRSSLRGPCRFGNRFRRKCSGARRSSTWIQPLQCDVSGQHLLPPKRFILTFSSTESMGINRRDATFFRSVGQPQNFRDGHSRRLRINPTAVRGLVCLPPRPWSKPSSLWVW